MQIPRAATLKLAVSELTCNRRGSELGLESPLVHDALGDVSR